MPLCFRLVPEVNPSARRAVGFIEGDTQLDAGPQFEAFDVTTKGVLRRHMDWWIAERENQPKKYHGFEEKEFRELFVFKYVAEGIRLYGFKCHPTLNSNKRFLLVALCIFDSKFRDDTDKAILRQVERWRTNLGAQTAIRAYPDFRKAEEEFERGQR